MFGYITVNKPELKVKEFELYRSYYCGLCRELKEKYGVVGRIGLSYDMNFLILLLTGLYEPKDRVSKRNCILHPFEKCSVRINEYTEYAADMNLLLMYHKCEDDWLDEKKYGSAVYKKLLEKGRKKVKNRYRDKVAQIEEAIYSLMKCEMEAADIDKIAGLSGEMLGHVFVCKQDAWEEELYKMGFYLGKFIYLCDAYEDLEEDLKKGRYNPFQTMYRDNDFEDMFRNMLTMMMAECCKAFEKLPILENVDILRNILYSGVWRRYEKARKERSKGEEHGR